MRGLSLSIVPLVASAAASLEAAPYYPIYEVYGEMSPVDSMRPRMPSRRTPRDDRDPNNCTFPIDVIIIQDATGTFADDWDNMVYNELPVMVEVLEVNHPGTHFGVVVHKDKPIYPLGLDTDFCVDTEIILSHEKEDVLKLYNRNIPYGGGDVAECQFVALLAGSQLPFPWNEEATKLFIVVTDAPPHFEDDGSNTMNLPPHTDEYDILDPEGQCISQYYPSPDQVRQSILQVGGYLAVAVHAGDYMNGLVKRSWEWMVRFMEQPDNFVQDLTASSDNFWEALSAIITSLEDIECAPDKTTTRSPGTTPAPHTTTGGLGAASTSPMAPTTTLDCPPCPTSPTCAARQAKP
eukprot:Protomagalhaensia_wolfi_Nauph_80__1627@NODE_2003_length_1248_cov_17_794045_g1568_i0_p1_GENE_NODE_2003_length_1248_cov_17_794045_g1568_i0NODE_2003_length_1248_cov_17_794045_g1568_i0_p1_ORF_typecomplete_len350_score63_80Integrin_beta/PF00362_18/3_3e16VWA/PF00092_28/0_073VWA/PF00092_28/4_7e03_NODE_2003_length_1248_cov_17_794045_g1568_i0641113